jgi:integrase
LNQSDIYKAMDKNSENVGFANYIPTAITILAKIAKRKNWITSNPAEGVERLKVPNERKKPHIPWTDEAVELWRKNAGPLPRLIFEIGVGSVQRPGDWVDFKWIDYDGASLSLNQNKTGKWLWLPCSEHLKAALDSEVERLGGSPDPGQHIISKSNGIRMTYREMAKVMYAERVRLGVEAHDQHALRYRGVMELAAAGCTDDQIASYSGHSSKAMIIKYAGMARQKMRASEAAMKRSKQSNKATTKSETDTRGDTL